jgi:hypothetical protein
VQIKEGGEPGGLVNVVLRLLPAPDVLPRTVGVTDRHGEALLAVPAASPVMVASGGATGGALLAAEFNAQLETIIDRAVVRPESDLRPPVPDPDLVLRRAEANHADIRKRPALELTLAAGRSTRALVEVPRSEF